MGTTALKARNLLKLSKPIHTCCSSANSNSIFSTTTTPTTTTTNFPIFRTPSTTTHVTSTPRFTVARHSLQCALTENDSDDDLIVPPLVGDLSPCSIDPGHYQICTLTKGLQFESASDLLDYYIQILAKVVGSVEEAKKKIYSVSCEWNYFHFGAKIDAQTSNKLQVLRGVAGVLPDFYLDARDNSAIADPTFEFIPVNRNRRLFNIFDYQKSSECNMEGDSGHWLINIDQSVGGFASTDDFVDCCSEMLAPFVGSKEEAKQRMFIIWCIYPFGFGAEIDAETSKKLKDLPNVLDVLQDYAFDMKRKEYGALIIESSPDENSAPVPFYKELVKKDSEVSFLHDSDVEDISEDGDTCVVDSDVEDISEGEDFCQLDSDIEDTDPSVSWDDVACAYCNFVWG